jgi:hypothetical protein
MTWVNRRRKALIGLVTITLACNGLPDGALPQFVSYEIVEGAPSCSGCDLTGTPATPGADGVLTLHLNAVYTARSHIRTAGQDGRCIYRVFGYSWWLPDHNFHCTPETGDMLLDDSIPTDSSLAQGAVSPNVSAALSEYDTATRSAIGPSQNLFALPVRFVP